MLKVKVYIYLLYEDYFSIKGTLIAQVGHTDLSADTISNEPTSTDHDERWIYGSATIYNNEVG